MRPVRRSETTPPKVVQRNGGPKTESRSAKENTLSLRRAVAPAPHEMLFGRPKGRNKAA